MANGRPAVALRTLDAHDSAKRGKRKMHRMGSKEYPPVACFPVAHVVLISVGRFPQEDEEASHLCHSPTCINPAHLVWERGDFNRRRRHCVREGECVCGLLPRCLLKAHE